MTMIDSLRRVAAMGLVVVAGVRLEADARGQAASAPRTGAILGRAAVRATPVVSAYRRTARLAMTPPFDAGKGFTTDSSPLGSVGGGGLGEGVLGGGTADGGVAERNGPSVDDRAGVPMGSLAQARPSVGPAPVLPGSGVAPVLPGIGVAPVVPPPQASTPPPFLGNNPMIGGFGGFGGFDGLGYGGFGVGGLGVGGYGGFGVGGLGVGGYGGFGVGGLGVGGFGYPGMYGGFAGPYGGYGMSLPPTPELGDGAYRAGNNLPGPAAGPGMGDGVPADPNAPRARNAGPNAVGEPPEDPFDAAAVGKRPPGREIRSKRAYTGRRPGARKPARQPSKKPEARASEARPNRPEVKTMRDEKPTAAAKAEGAKPAARPRSVLGTSR